MAKRDLTIFLLGDSKSLDRTFQKVSKGADHMGSRVASGAKIAAAALAGGLVIGAKKAVDAFGEADQVAAQTRATLKSTGAVANVTAKDIGDLATAISRKSGLDDEAVQSASNLLLTFTKVRNEVGDGNDVFDRATQTVADFSVVFKKDLAGSAVLVGKALNDPVKGLTALQRVGVQFTKGQKEQIEALVKGGDTLKAQKLILKELEVQTKGAAEAYGDTLPGKIDKAKVAVGNLQEAIGGALAPVVADAADGIASFVSQLTTSDRPAALFEAVGDQVSDVKDAIAGLFDDFGKRRGAGDSFAAALGGTIADAVSDVDWDEVGDTISTGFSAGVDWTGKLAPAVADGIGTALGQVDGRELLSGLLRVVSEGIEALFSPSFWKDNFAAIFSTVTIAIPVAKILKIPGADFLYRHISKPIFSAFGSLGKGLVSRLGAIGESGVTGFLGGLEKLAPRTANVLLDVVTGSGKWLSGLPGKFKSAGGRAVDRLTDAIGGGVGAIGSGIGRLIGGGLKKLGSLTPDWARAGGRFARELTQGLLRGLVSLPGKVAGKVKGGLSAIGGFFGIGDGIGRALGERAPKGGGNLMGANPALGGIASLAERLGGRVSSGLRRGAITSSGNPSYHATGEAVDIGGPATALARIFTTLKRSGRRFAELIYTGPGGGTGIRNGRPHTYTGQVAADHRDHVHAALDLGRSGTGIGDGYGKSSIMNLWTRAGGSPQLANLAAAVALAESGGNSQASNRNTNGTVDRGLWQINSIHGKLSTFDPAGNARSAVQISAGGKNWTPWVAYKSGAYKKFLGGGRASAPTAAEQRKARADAAEKSGSRLVNQIAGRFSKSVATATRSARSLGVGIEDAEAAYGRRERKFGQTEEDLGTSDGRAKRVDELRILKQEKQKQINAMKKRLAQLKKAEAGLIKTVAGINAKLKGKNRAKGAKAVTMRSRRKKYQDDLVEVRAEIKGLGGAIEDAGLDLGDLDKDIADVSATPDTVVDPGPSPTDRMSADLELVDLRERAGVTTPEQAAAERARIRSGALAGAYGALDERQQLQIQGDMLEAQRTLAAALDDAAAEIKGLRDEMARSNAIAASTLGVTWRELAEAFADHADGQLGVRAAARRTMPGTGQLSRL